MLSSETQSEGVTPDRTLWIRHLRPAERTVFVATFAGWMLDGMDVMVFSLVLPTLLTSWNISRGEAGLLSTATLLISSVGGWLAGILADRYGRVKILKITIFCFAFFTFLSGFTQNFGQLLIVRGLQGLGFGGEWAVGATLMGETIRSRYRGRAVGTVQAGWAVGWGLSVVCFDIVFSTLRTALAWRVMFWIGILPALLIVYIRGKVHEPAVSLAPERTGQTSALDIFSRSQIRTTLLAALLALGAQGGYHAVTTWLPLYLTSYRGLTTLNTGSHLFVIITGAFCGYLAAAHLTDSIGRRRTLILFASCSLAAVLLYTTIPLSNHLMLLLGFPLGFFPSGSFSPMGAYFGELFPAPIRASGAGFAYNCGRGVGALFPALVGYVSGHTSLGISIATFGCAAYLIMILGAVLLPETRGRELQP